MTSAVYCNGDGFLLCPLIDKENGYRTIVCNINLQTTFKVNSFGYRLLEILENNPGISFDVLLTKYSTSVNKSAWEVKNEVESFISQMIKENVVIKNNL
ncbi:MAG: hypothetical protein Q8L51_03880 [Candidatus Amesbacteria bacterium]|nr:hypothetical protein [Candidatus Amesbacteria bacterium]